MINTDGTGVSRFSHSYAIDTEPVFSPDGKYIYFTSDRGGSAQIYRQALEGGTPAERVTFGADYAVSPALNPDGTVLTYVTRVAGRFRVTAMDLASGQEMILTNNAADESPCFSPNGQMIVYATERAKRGVLATVSTDGAVHAWLTGPAGARIKPTAKGRIIVNRIAKTISAAAAAALLLLTGCSTVELDESLKEGTTQAEANAKANAADAESTRATSEHSVYFAFDSYSVEDKYLPVIERNARRLIATPSQNVTIEGNTDSRGSREYNLALGQKRSEAVKQRLQLLGVPSSRIEAVSFGREKPVDLGENEEAWAKNRRADVIYR